MLTSLDCVLFCFSLTDGKYVSIRDEFSRAISAPIVDSSKIRMINGIIRKSGKWNSLQRLVRMFDDKIKYETQILMDISRINLDLLDQDARDFFFHHLIIAADSSQKDKLIQNARGKARFLYNFPLPDVLIKVVYEYFNFDDYLVY